MIAASSASYVAMDDFAAPRLLVRPDPKGIGTAEVESLSGYLQRVGAANHLPISSLLSVLRPARHNRGRWSTNPERWPKDLAALATLTAQPVPLLEQMTVLPIFRVFYGAQPTNRWTVWQFFRSYGQGALFANVRRYCPACLREALVYQLQWQFCEITACVRHGTLLVDTCHACGRRLRVLPRRSALGRCAHCGQLLTATRPQAAPTEVIAQQRRIQRDYDLLLTGRITFAEPGRSEAGIDGFLRRAERIRADRGTGWYTFARSCGLSPDSIKKTRVKKPGLATCLQLARRVSGSLEAFTRVPPASHMAPSLKQRLNLPCLNPWCADHGSPRPTFSKGSVYLCRTCGCSFSRRRQTLYTLPVERFYRCLHEACAQLPAVGEDWLAPFTAAGLSLRMRNFVLRRLIRSGIVALHTGRWTRAYSPATRIHGYPATPLLIMGAKRRAFRLGDRVETFSRQVRKTLREMALQGDSITVRALAARLKVNLNTLRYRLRALEINVRSDTERARKIARTHQLRTHERAARRALPNIVARCIARGERPSFEKFSRALGLSPARLKRRHPVLATVIVQACKHVGRERYKRLKKRVRQIVRALESRGEIPTQQRVAARLGFDFVGNPELNPFFRKLRRLPT